MTNVCSVVLILQVTKHGLILDFLSSFTGQVDFLHMEPEQASSYKEGDEVKIFLLLLFPVFKLECSMKCCFAPLTQVRACVLYVEPSTRLVALSLRSYLLQSGSRVDVRPPGGDRVGEVVKSCKMTTVHHMSGAMLELPDKTVVFSHVS